MTNEPINTFESFLIGLSEAEWQSTVVSLLPSIHEVDRNAVQIWFRFYPLELQRYLTGVEDTDEAKRGLAMQGDFGLERRVDTSHSFLYGHRYWETAKEAILRRCEDRKDSNDLRTEITEIATAVGKQVGADTSLTLAITAVGLMTLTQVGLTGFGLKGAPIAKPSGLMAKSPDAIVDARQKDDSQGMFGFLKTVNKKFSVIHDEASGLRFEIVNDQEIASASANDRSHDWQAKDQRCWEGPVPVECTSASCGTCWVGVIAGQEKLSTVERRERRAVKVFGYTDTDDSQPLIRLACQAKAHGNVTIVIPPWNAVFGKKVYGNVEELELEPVTTSAKTLREVTREATAGE